MVPVDRRDAATLLQIIEDFVLPGTSKLINYLPYNENFVLDNNSF